MFAIKLLDNCFQKGVRIGKKKKNLILESLILGDCSSCRNV